MAVFPFFIEIKDKKCIVVGGGAVAERKIEALFGFGAKITVISLKVNEKIHDFERAGRITLKKRKYCSEDLDGAFLVIASTNNSKTNEKIYKDALEKGIFVNVVDCLQMCTFIFPSIIKRGDMVLGISTSGSYPALSKNIRQKLERLFPDEFGGILETLKEYRIRAVKMIIHRGKRVEFLTKILDGVLEQNISTLEEFKEKAEVIFKEYSDEKDY